MFTETCRPGPAPRMLSLKTGRMEHKVSSDQAPNGRPRREPWVAMVSEEARTGDLLGDPLALRHPLPSPPPPTPSSKAGPSDTTAGLAQRLPHGLIPLLPLMFSQVETNPCPLLGVTWGMGVPCLCEMLIRSRCLFPPPAPPARPDLPGQQAASSGAKGSWALRVQWSQRP